MHGGDPNTKPGWLWGPHLEEGHGGAGMDGAVLNVGLVCQVISRLYGHLHTLHGEEGSQVGRVGGDDDQGEGPPEGWEG